MIELPGEALAVRHQGDRRTCVGFATAAAHESARDEGEQLSAEDVMWAAHELMGMATSEETSVELALYGVEGEQHAIEEAWPYGVPIWRQGRPQAATETANQRRLPRWRRLSEVSIPAVRAEIAVGNPVILTVGVVKPAWLTPAGGLIDVPAGATVRGNHAVLAVGASGEGEDPQVVRFRNSWGDEWALNGYGLMTRRYLENYGLCAHAIERKK